ncbi:MAG: hypothetical protein H0X44_06580, partial [Acidobacteria bacterium]|nr:hypothetical protein [Acidobacteriota bacterium]
PDPVDPDDPVEDDPLDVEPADEPPRGAALLPDDEEPDVGLRESCAIAGVASASAISALRGSLSDACMAEPRT